MYMVDATERSNTILYVGSLLLVVCTQWSTVSFVRVYQKRKPEKHRDSIEIAYSSLHTFYCRSFLILLFFLHPTPPQRLIILHAIMIEAADNNSNTRPNAKCVECQKSSQKELPNRPLPDSSSDPASERRCSLEYLAVQKCMESHQGQISDCKGTWDVFRVCHNSVFD